MGNCIRKESSMQWGGEDWGFTMKLEEDDDDKEDIHQEVKVKVKITKKQLTELMMGKADVQGLSVVHQLLMNVSERFEPWRPSLQTIPEDT
ncbi:hypothetical protein EJD97_004453 [Solanum chilense]|uniref:Uncharacterized protein n=1 Tax=Solanum chilense TaxID=4083 RepID=A0A6N2C157_SOLCI|nr:hypothetical protein EJD97_004453 [Solanum chilense]